MYPLREEKKVRHHKTAHIAHRGFPCYSTKRDNLNEPQTLMYGEVKKILKITMRNGTTENRTIQKRNQVYLDEFLHVVREALIYIDFKIKGRIAT